MKKGLILVIAIAILYPVAAWLLGYSIEQRVEDTKQQLRERTPYVRIVDSHFHRGWFVSEQDFTVEIFGAMSSASPPHITVHNVIHHGPVCGLTCVGLARIDSHLVFSDQIEPLPRSIFGSSEPLIIRSKLGFLGGGSMAFSSPSIANAVLSNGDHLSSDGLAFDGGYGANFNSYSIRGALPHVVYTGAGGQGFEVVAVDFDASAKRALRSLYTGDTSVAIGRLAFSAAGSPGAFAANDLLLKSHSSMADGFKAATVKYDVGSVTTPSVTLASAHFDVTFSHLDAESLDKLTVASREVNQDSAVPPAARMSKMLSVLKSPAIELLAHQPEISIDRLSVATAAGSALLSGVVKTHGILAKDFGDNADVKALSQKIDADMDLTIDDAFLTSVPGGADSAARLQGFVGQGLLTHDGGKYHTMIGFHQGQMTFNGKPFGPSMAVQK
jgi:uncharacterized protein YdgA (DUF945 family)